MDLKQFSDFFLPSTCIISVEKFPDGSYGNIRIVTGNDTYMDTAKYYREFGTETVTIREFVPNQPYETYIPKDMNFEDSCYRCAILGKTIHSYVKLERFDFWINFSMIPLHSDSENTGYCIYSQELTKEVDTKMQSNISHETAESVLSTCIKLHRKSDLKSAMNEIIKDIRDLCGASQCCILMSDFSQRKCSVLCEAMNDEKLKSIQYYLDTYDDFFGIVASWDETISGSTCLIISNEHDMNTLKERNPKWHKSLVLASVKSLVLFPLKSDDETLGYLWALNFNTEDTPHIKETLELVTFFIASEISRHQLMSRLKTLSSMDMLTGVFNRNAMNNRVEILTVDNKNKTMGIVFADLNGLKRVNDCEGHFAGDLLIKNASLVLQKCFSEYEIYRAGGDEFMIIALDISGEELEKRVENLKKSGEKSGVSFAVGYCSDSIYNIKKAMQTADERMYEDKEKFYKLRPEMRRK